MGQNNLLFDTIREDDFTNDKYMAEREKISKLDIKNENQLKILLSNFDDLYRIVSYKHSINEQLKTEDINEIVDFLEKNYYNQAELTDKINNIINILFATTYYKNSADIPIYIPLEFWKSFLGKMIISVLSANDDILISTAEVSSILGHKRQNINIMLRTGKLSARLIGGSFIFKLMDVINYKNGKK